MEDLWLKNQKQKTKRKRQKKPKTPRAARGTSHPQDSYGRCGYRFNKETAVRIPIADIPEEVVGVFIGDPYLACEYECE